MKKWWTSSVVSSGKEIRISLLLFGVLVSYWRTRLVSFCLFSFHAHSCSVLIRLDVKLKVSKSLITDTNYVDFVSVGRLSPCVAINRLLLLVTQPGNLGKLSQFSKPDYDWDFYIYTCENPCYYFHCYRGHNSPSIRKKLRDSHDSLFV